MNAGVKKSQGMGARLRAWGALVFFIALDGACAAAQNLDLASVQDPTLRQALVEGFNLQALGPHASVSPADWRAVEREQDRLSRMMRAFGYLDARTLAVDPPFGMSTLSSGETEGGTRASLKPIPGEAYRIGSIEVTGVVGSSLDPVVQEDLRAVLSGFAGDPARADTLSRLEGEVLFRIREASYPFVRVVSRELVTGQAPGLASVRIDLDVGEAARLGPVSFSGLNRLSSQPLIAQVQFSQGAPYRPAELEALKIALERVPLVQSARVRVAAAPDANGLAPVEVSIRERPIGTEQLTHLRAAGVAAMAAALALLGLRQVALAGGERPRSPGIRLLNIVVLVLLIAIAVLIAQRFRDLIGVP